MHYAGMNLPYPGAVDGEPPLVRIVRTLYANEEDIPDVPPPPPVLFLRAHEEELLREPFAMHGVSSRACLMGNCCVGTQLRGEAPGFAITELLTPDELSSFQLNGTLPPDRRSCLLCARMNLNAAHNFCAKRGSFPIGAHLNSFMNAYGQGEYKREHLIPEACNKAWTGVDGMVVGFFPDLVRIVRAPDQSLRVEQFAM